VFGALTGFGRFLLTSAPAWAVFISGLGVGLTTLLFSRVLLAEPPPFSPQRGRETWLKDGAAVFLFGLAIIFIMLPSADLDPRDLKAVVEEVAVGFGLPLLMAVLLAVPRRFRLYEVPRAIGFIPCPSCHHLKQAQWTYCGHCGLDSRNPYTPE
jgi:hypothetical protein